jgi:hypothetical protein
MERTSEAIVQDIEKYLQKSQKNALTFRLEEFMRFSNRSRLRGPFERQIHYFCTHHGLFYHRSPSHCFFVRDQHSFAGDVLKDSIRNGQTIDDCIQSIQNLFNAEPSRKVLSIPVKPNLYDFFGRKFWRESLTSKIQTISEDKGLQFIKASTCAFFVVDSDFDSATGVIC